MRWNAEFIQQATTIKNVDRDFTEWHQGREYYAVWALEIDEPTWLQCLQNARQKLQSYFLPGQARRAHITLFALGFVDDGDYAAIVDRQSELLKEAETGSFKLRLAQANSFSSAAYFEIVDPQQSIDKIRQLLLSCHQEDRCSTYVPHLTIGLYNEEYSLTPLLDELDACEFSDACEVTVDKISLMHYATDNIMSPLLTRQVIHLSE